MAGTWRLTAGVAAGAVVLGCLGCRGLGRAVGLTAAEGPANPFAFSRVAVVPFANLSDDASPASKTVLEGLPAIFHAELQRVKGLHVVPPGVVQETIRSRDLRLTNPQEVLEVARLLEADAVVVGAVTSYDPYFKPRVGLALEVYQRRPRGREAPDIVALAERGRPFPIEAGGQVPVAVVDVIYDSNDEAVDLAVRRFARRREALASAFGSERYLRDMEKYLAFVCHQAIAQLIADERARQEAERKGPRTGRP